MSIGGRNVDFRVRRCVVARGSRAPQASGVTPAPISHGQYDVVVCFPDVKGPVILALLTYFALLHHFGQRLEEIFRQGGKIPVEECLSSRPGRHIQHRPANPRPFAASLDVLQNHNKKGMPQIGSFAVACRVFHLPSDAITPVGKDKWSQRWSLALQLGRYTVFRMSALIAVWDLCRTPICRDCPHVVLRVANSTRI